MKCTLTRWQATQGLRKVLIASLARDWTEKEDSYKSKNLILWTTNNTPKRKASKEIVLMTQFLSAILVASKDQFKTDRGLSFASKLFLAVKTWYQCLLHSPLTAWPFLTSCHDHQFPIHTHESGMSHGSQVCACLWIFIDWTFIDFSPEFCSLIPFAWYSCVFDVLFGSFFFPLDRLCW